MQPHAPFSRSFLYRPNAILRAGLLAMAASLPAQAAPLAIPQAPIFLSTGVDPNIMLLLDNSGSMNNVLPDAPYEASTTYFTCPAGETLANDQNIRLRITGGGTPYFDHGGTIYAWGVSGGTVTLEGSGRSKKCFDPTLKYRAALYAKDDESYGVRAGGYGTGEYTGNYLNWYFGSAPTAWGSGARSKMGGSPLVALQKRRIEVARAAALNLVGTLNDVRLGLSVYNNDKGVRFLAGVNDIASNRANLTTQLNGVDADGYTPLAESLRDIGEYFAMGSTGDLTIHPGQSTTSGSKFNQASVSKADLFARADYTPDFSGLTAPIQHFCQKNFAVILTDGRSTKDRDIATPLQDYDGDCKSPIPYSCDTGDRKPASLGYSYEDAEGSDYLDDVAHALYDIDLRPDLSESATKPTKNNLSTYIIGFADLALINDKLPNDAAQQGGGRFFTAENADQLAVAFQETLADILSKKGSASAIAANSSRITTDARIFQAGFDGSDWSGSLSAFSLNTAADEKADATKKEGAIKQKVWTAKTPLPASRKIYTRNDATSTGVEFKVLADLSTAQQTSVNNLDLLNYLRGDTARELRNTTTGVRYRNRTFCDPISGDATYTNCLGDIVNFDPLFVGALNFGYELLPEGAAGRSSYTPFRNANKARTQMVYVGANDGMLHAFDAATGIEKFAYIPNAVFPNLAQLSNPAYSHRFYVDGPASVGDAYFDSGWHRVLVGTTGAGGRAVFALDVTDPDNFGASKVLWEFTDPDLGITMSQPTVARMQDGQWVAIFGNGYNSNNQHAVLFIVDVRNGTLIKKIDTGAGSATTPNGLASAALIPDPNRTVAYAYAGDLLGNLWKFDLSGNTPGTWGIAFAPPNALFKAKDALGNPQPITAAPDVALHPKGGYLVAFGTGKYLENADHQVPADPPAQSLYGVWDNNSAFSGTDHRASLVQQTIDHEVSQSGFGWRIMSQNTVDWATKRGWYLDLISPGPVKKGERVIAAPRITDDGRAQFTTYIPSTEPCKPEGDSWLMQIDAFSGARLAFTIFDVNNDGKFDSADKVTAGSSDQVPSGVRRQPGVVDNYTGLAGSASDALVGSQIDGNGNPDRLRVRGGLTSGRQSWRQLY